MFVESISAGVRPEQRTLAGCSPWGLKELDSTERLSKAQHQAYLTLFSKENLYHFGCFSSKQ